MSSMNRVTLLGRVGKDPEIKETKTGKKVAKFSLATQRDKENTDWHTIVLWEKNADVAERFVAKGSQILIEGRLQYDQWQADDGTKRERATVIGDRLVLLGERQREGSASSGAKPKPYDSGDGKGRNLPEDDDIPF